MKRATNDRARVRRNAWSAAGVFDDERGSASCARRGERDDRADHREPQGNRTEASVADNPTPLKYVAGDYAAEPDAISTTTRIAAGTSVPRRGLCRAG